MAFILALELQTYLNLNVQYRSKSEKESWQTYSQCPLPHSLPQFVRHSRKADKRRQKPIFVMMHVGNEEVRVGGNKERKGREGRKYRLTMLANHDILLTKVNHKID